MTSHRYAVLALESSPHVSTWNELRQALESIDDHRLRLEFVLGQRSLRAAGKRPASGIQATLNKVIRDELLAKGWASESKLFRDASLSRRKWSLDFAKGAVAVEVAFNHAEALPHNLVKPTLAGELNHLTKEHESEVGVVVLATRALKAAGNMDRAVGTYEDALTYLKAYRSILTTPLLLIGLGAPDTFLVERRGTLATTLPNGSRRYRFFKGAGRGPSAGVTRRIRVP